MRLDSFDLNLLVAFDVLLEERSVTNAARRLNVTQSAMSASLKRLREAFQDEILVQHGKKMIPTAHAMTLAPQISETIFHLRSLISVGTAFDAAISQRHFRIAASDYITTVLIVPLLELLQREAPNVRLDLTLPSAATAPALGNGEIDLVLAPGLFLHTEHPKELLFEERHVVVGWSENPVMQNPLTLESFFACGHVAVRISNSDTFVESALRKFSPQRRIEVTAPSFIQAPWLLPGTLRLALMHERLAKIVAEDLSLSIAESPIDLPIMRELMQHHDARSNDPGLQWLRSRLIHLAKANKV